MLGLLPEAETRSILQGTTFARERPSPPPAKASSATGPLKKQLCVYNGIYGMLAQARKRLAIFVTIKKSQHKSIPSLLNSFSVLDRRTSDGSAQMLLFSFPFVGLFLKPFSYLGVPIFILCSTSLDSQGSILPSTGTPSTAPDTSTASFNPEGQRAEAAAVPPPGPCWRGAQRHVLTHLHQTNCLHGYFSIIIAAVLAIISITSSLSPCLRRRQSVPVRWVRARKGSEVPTGDIYFY